MRLSLEVVWEAPSPHLFVLFPKPWLGAFRQFLLPRFSVGFTLQWVRHVTVASLGQAVCGASQLCLWLADVTMENKRARDSILLNAKLYVLMTAAGVFAPR